MTIANLIILLLIHKYKYSIFAKRYFRLWVNKYLNLFINKKTISLAIKPHSLRLLFITSLMPILFFAFILHYVGMHYWIFEMVISLVVIVLMIDILSSSWQLGVDLEQFTEQYFTRFFAPLFWFLVAPSIFGLISYFFILLIAKKMRSFANDNQAYYLIIDKFLFYVNLPPFICLIIILMLVGDFEEVMHFVVENTKNIRVSAFMLNKLLAQIAMLALSRKKNISSEQEAFNYDDRMHTKDEIKHHQPNNTISDYRLAQEYALFNRASILIILLTVLCSIVYYIK